MAVTSLDLAGALRDEVVALMRGAEERVRFDLAAGEDVVPGRALLDDAALMALVKRAGNVDITGIDPRADLRASASRFVRQYARAILYAVMGGLAAGIRIDASIDRISFVMRRNIPFALVLRSRDLRAIAPDMHDVAREEVLNRLFVANLLPVVRNVERLVRVSAKVNWNNLAEVFALVAEAARDAGRDAATYYADRDAVLDRARLPGMRVPNPLRGQVRWVSVDDPRIAHPILVRRVCCACFILPDRPGRKCLNCPLVSTEELIAMNVPATATS